ncbi:serine protease FAM111A-like [Symphorus nematophorus]
MPRKPPKKTSSSSSSSPDIRPFFKKPDSPDSTSSTTTESTQPAGAAGSQPGGAAGSQDHPGSSSSSTTESTQPGGAAGPKNAAWSQVKKENDGNSTDGHSHRFKVKFSPSDHYKYPVDCYQPRTVLEAIQSLQTYSKKMKKCSNENIVIQLGKADKESIVATHFPCSCIRDDECLIMSCESEKVEEAQGQHYNIIQPRDNYSVFYIDTVGGVFTKKKKLFRNTAVKQFKFLCVYGEKGMTVEEALKRDGRFIDDLGNFALSDNHDPKCITERTQKVDNLDQKEFKIRLPRNTRTNDEKHQENTSASNNTQNGWDISAVLDQRGISVRAAVENSGGSVDIQEIYKILRKQFPGLKEWMESRFPGDSFKEELNLRKENFGKIQQSFSEVHRVRKLLKLGESVCKVVVMNVCLGTGFVLFDNFILTNAHLFKDCVEGGKLREGVEVFVLFNYEDPEPHTNYYYFQLAHRNLCYIQDELDYAILELNPESHKPNQTTQTKKTKVPPGLLKKFGPMPLNGEACIIGHPAGGVKKIDPTFIIGKEKREQAVKDLLHRYKDNLFIVHLIKDAIKEQGIENIMMGGIKAEKVVTYNTFMYHGSSGSPVFDAHGQVFGLHTGGYVCGFSNQTESVVEFAQPLLTIFEHFVSELKKCRQEQLLKRVEEEAKDNQYLKKIFKKATDPDECSDSDESMEID